MKVGKILTVDEKELLSELRDMMPQFFKDYAKTREQAERLVPYMEEMYWDCINDRDEMWRLTAPKQEY